jgi:hypothetical protein
MPPYSSSNNNNKIKKKKKKRKEKKRKRDKKGKEEVTVYACVHMKYLVFHHDGDSFQTSIS